jgi:hypothetical protein
MTPAAHLTGEQFARFRDRTLAPAELLELDGHLALCEPCRERLYADAHGSSEIRALRAEVSGHLEYEDIVACSEGSSTEAQRAHLRDCPLCRSEVQDLSRFRTALQETPRAKTMAAVTPIRSWRKWAVPAGIAAAVLVVAGVALESRRRPVPPVATTQPAGEPALAAADREVLDRATASNRFERAPVLDPLQVKPGTLLGSRSGRSVILYSPVGTTVVRDRPLLQWAPVAGASTYVVSIFDEKFEKIAESPSLTGTDWQPARPLPRGRILSWQVAATTPHGTVRDPVPPAPEARFELVPQDVADHIAAMRQQHPGNALLLAALYAHAGALDEAQQELNAMDPAAAEPYRESIARIRRGE